MTTSFQFRYEDGIIPNLSAFGYLVAAYVGGVALMTSSRLWANALGVLLMAHALAVSAFLIHELIHGTIFRKGADNVKLAQLLSWFNGSCYALVLDLKTKHIQHHVDRADVITFDFRAILARFPWLRATVVALEWAYFPAVEFLMRLAILFIPFVDVSRRRQQRRVVTLLVVRIAIFALLAWLAPRVFVLYWVAYVLFVTFMRFIDAFQHTYDAVVLSEDSPLGDRIVRDRDYEELNTYSNLISLRYPLINLLTLNFVYHNAHHARPGVPWHQLPALHARLYSEGQAPQVIPATRLLHNFHKFRVRRVIEEDFGEARLRRYESFVGTVGVSFLTAV